MRIDLRRSAWLAASLTMLGILAAIGLWLSDAPAAMAAIGSPLCVGYGALLARREWRRPAMSLVLHAASVRVDDAGVDDFRIDWQGVFTRLQWRDGARTHRRVAWPDVIDAGLRRELRLWTWARRTDAAPPAVAP